MIIYSSIRSKYLLGLFGISLLVLIAGCSKGEQGLVRAVSSFISVEDCKENGISNEHCLDGYNKAMYKHRTSNANFGSAEGCMASFPENTCYQNQNSRYEPRIAGYMIIVSGTITLDDKATSPFGEVYATAEPGNIGIASLKVALKLLSEHETLRFYAEPVYEPL